MAKGNNSEGFFDMKLIVTIVVVIILCIAGVAAYNHFSTTQDGFAGPDRFVESGDKVLVNYTGMFEDGTVFDTSRVEVAEDNALYPKAFSFTGRASYTTLSFTVGNNEVVEGFENGVIGMAVGQTKTVTIPSDKAYGDSDPELIKTFDIIDTIPMYSTEFNTSTFKSTYYVEPTVGMTVTDAVWGWDTSVYFVDENADEVILKFEPTIGQVLDYVGAWDYEVIGLDSSTNGGEITIKHLVTEADANNIYSHNNVAPFMLSGVDTTAGTYTLDYNAEVVGKTLVFQITVEEIIDQ